MEKRQIPRFSVPVQIEGQNDSGDAVFFSSTKDISMRGMKVVSSKELLEGTVIHVRFFFPDLPMEEALAKIVWKNKREFGFEYGCSFVKIPEKVKEDLYNYLIVYSPHEFQKRWWNS